MDRDISVDVFDVDDERRRRFLLTRPIGYAAGALLVAPLAWFWDENRLLWLSIGMLLVGASSFLARSRDRVRPLTALLLLDVVWTGVVIAALGVHPLAASLLFAGHASTGYLTLPVRHTRAVVGSIVVAMAAVVAIDPVAPPSMTSPRILVAEVVMTAFGLASVIGDSELIGAARRQVERRRQLELVRARQVAEQRAAALRTVSHELRTPLTSIGGFAHFLTSDALSHEERVEFARRITNESTHLNHLVDDLLASVRLDAGQLDLHVQPVAIVDSAKRVADVFRPRGLEIEVEVDPFHVVAADAARLEQILRNLLSNAEKYGGASARVTSRQEGDRIVVLVTDDGPGVQPEDRDRIFDDFTQRGEASHLTGTGLGLGISRRLARAMGGDLRCVAAATGACFELVLPAHA